MWIHTGASYNPKTICHPHQATIQKPDGNTYCPASGKKLRLKDLTPVKFTPVPQGQSGRHQDPITHDTFTNKHRLVLLKATGDVMLEETYNKCVKPEGMYNGVRIREVVQLQRGGTGFAAHDGDKLQVCCWCGECTCCHHVHTSLCTLSRPSFLRWALVLAAKTCEGKWLLGNLWVVCNS